MLLMRLEMATTGWRVRRASWRFLIAQCAIIGMLVPSDVVAQTESQQSIPVGEARLFPSVTIGYFQNSNAFLSNTDPVESTGFNVQPVAIWVADRRRLALRAGYRGDYATNSESALDYADHQLFFEGSAEFSSRKRLEGSITFDNAHQELGSLLTRTTADADSKQVRFNLAEFELEYTYGATEARGNLIFGTTGQILDFTNRTDVTSNQSLTSFTPYAAFSYRLSGDTRALVEASYGTTNYSGSRGSRSDLTLFTGLRFAATGKSGGEFKIGTVISDYSVGSADSNTTLALQTELFHEPTSFSKIVLNATRTLDNEASNPLESGDDQAFADEVKLQWNNYWSSRTSSIAAFLYTGNNRVCPDISSTRTEARFSVSYDIRRWFSVGGRFSASQRVGDACAESAPGEAEARDYDKQLIGVFVRATL